MNIQQIKFKDNKLVGLWNCQTCQSKAEVFLDFYKDYGIPSCPCCGGKMNYEGTFLLVDMTKTNAVKELGSDTLEKTRC